MKDNTSEAVSLAMLGYRVLPLHSPNGDRCDCNSDGCPSPAKHPRVKGWTDWPVNPPPEEIARYWGMWPHANVGIVAGASGLVILDVDPRNDGVASLQRLTEEHGVLPFGPRARTGGGGLHFYFKHPDRPLGNSAGQIGPGLDSKCDGGYVVAPPSVHATGVSYRWDVDDEGLELSPWNVEPPELPLWLLLLMETAAAKPMGGTQPVGSVIAQGERRSRLMSLGGTVRHRGASESEIYAYLMAVNAERCVPPFDGREIAKLSAQIAQFEVGEAVVVVGPKTRGEKAPRVMPEPFSAVELMAMDLPEVKWAVPELLPEGLAVLAGKPKLGKSWMSFNLGIAIAEGGIALGAQPVDEGDVLILALEDNKRRLKKRMGIMLGGEPPHERLMMAHDWPREDEGGLEAIDAWLGAHPQARMVVIDTLAKFRPKAIQGKNSNGPGYSDDYGAMENLQEMAGRHGVCILLITHYRKQFSDDWVDSITGTLGIAGGADTLLGLERKRGEQIATLHVTGRDVDENDWACELDPKMGRWSILGDAADAKAGRETAALIDALMQIGEPATIQHIAALMGKTTPATKSLLYRAAATGFIKSYGGGVFGTLTEPVSAFHGGVPRNATMQRESEESFIVPPVPSVASVASVPFSAHLASTFSDSDATPPPTEHNYPHPSHSTTRADRVSFEKKENETHATGWPSKVLPFVPVKPCPGCGEVAWTLRVGGRWMCGNCRPAVAPVGGEG